MRLVNVAPNWARARRARTARQRTGRVEPISSETAGFGANAFAALFVAEANRSVPLCVFELPHAENDTLAARPFPGQLDEGAPLVETREDVLPAFDGNARDALRRRAVL